MVAAVSAAASTNMQLNAFVVLPSTVMIWVSSVGLMLTATVSSCELLLDEAVGVIESMAIVPWVVATYLPPGGEEAGEQNANWLWR